MVKVFFISIISACFSILFAQNGSVKTYYPSGKVASRQAFIKDVLEGTSYWYYENGNLKALKEYSDGKLNGSMKNFYSNGLVKDEFYYLDGVLHGVSKSYYDNGGLSEVRNYSFGELTSQNIIDYDSAYIAPLSLYDEGKGRTLPNENDFICGTEICPEPPGGIEEIEEKIVYPELAKQFQLEGFVLLTATINLRGIAENIRIDKGLGLGCDEAAVEAVKKTKFIPGRNNGEEVRTDVTFKVNFRIKDSSGKELTAHSGNSYSVEGGASDSAGALSVSKDFIVCDTDICPEPVGGIMGLIRILRYPPQAKRKKIEGEVVIKAKVNEIGFVTSAEILKGLGYGCDEAAKSAIIKTQFEPGKNKDSDTESTIEVRVPFILDDNLK